MKKELRSTNFGSGNTTSPKSEKLETNTPQHDVAIIHIIWIDTSGQHRCHVAQHFNNVVKSNGVELTFAYMAMTSAIDGAPDETNLTGVG